MKGEHMKLTAFQYGKTYIQESLALSGGNKDISLPISLLFFLIEEGDEKMLIDVGCDTMPGFFLEEHISPVALLEKQGVKREDITSVFLTHAHHDHAECAHYYKNAKIIIHKEALPHASGFLKENGNICVFETEFSPIEGVKIIPIGGHAQGSSIMAVSSPEGGEIILCGDECYVKEGFLEQRLSGAVLNKEKMTEFLAKYKEHPGKILFHDKDVVGYIGCKVIFET